MHYIFGSIIPYHVGLVQIIDVSKEFISSTVYFVVGGSTITDVSKKLPASFTIGPLWRRQALCHIGAELCPGDSTMNMDSREKLRSNTGKTNYPLWDENTSL
jgi:hypothetical protein